MAGERQLKIQRSPVSKVRGTGRGEGGRTVCGNTFLEPVLKFADLAAHYSHAPKCALTYVPFFVDSVASDGVHIII